MSTQKVSGDWSVRELPAKKYSKKCPHSMTPVGICLHNTANSAAASGEINYMQTNNSSTSYHFAVDEREAIQGLPLNRNGWHAGDGGSGKGNRKHIGVEIARSTDQTPGRFAMAEKRAAAVCAKLLGQYGWGVNNIKAHRDFSGKNCPHRTSMSSFRNLVSQALGGKLTEEPKNPAPQQPAPVVGGKKATVTASVLNVRSGAGTNHGKIGSLKKGATVTYSAETNGWLQINYNNRVGFISKAYTKTQASSSPVPKPSTPNQGTAMQITASVLNVRKGPGTSYKVVGTLSKGAKVTSLGTQSNGWVKISFKGGVAYISGKYAKSVNSGSQPAPAPAPKPQGTTMYTNANSLNVRKGPGTSYATVGSLPHGSKITVLSTEANGWHKISFQGGSAYVSGKYVQKAQPSGSTPTPTPGPVGTGSLAYMSTRAVAAADTGRKVKKVIDLQTRKEFNVSWDSSPGYHSDWTPMTSADTSVIKSILNPSKVSDAAYWRSTKSWSWTGRPGAIQLKNGTWIACGFHLRPHAAIMGGNPGAPLTNKSNTRPSGGWAIGGHMCMYYGDSPGGTQDCNRAAKDARNMKL